MRASLEQASWLLYLACLELAKDRQGPLRQQKQQGQRRRQKPQRLGPTLPQLKLLQRVMRASLELANFGEIRLREICRMNFAHSL
jgi:hypothetical protein